MDSQCAGPLHRRGGELQHHQILQAPDRFTLMGAETRTRWSEEALFKLVDDRYRLRLPLAMAVATNLAPDDLEPRIGPRLRYRALARVERLARPDWRVS